MRDAFVALRDAKVCASAYDLRRLVGDDAGDGGGDAGPLDAEEALFMRCDALLRRSRFSCLVDAAYAPVRAVADDLGCDFAARRRAKGAPRVLGKTREVCVINK